MWKKPLHGVTKVNINTSFFAETLSGATRAVTRDERGNFVAATTWFLPHMTIVEKS